MADWPPAWDYPSVVLAALLTVTLVALVVVASTSTAAFGTYNPAWDGASDLRSLARETGAEATVARNLEPYGRVNPADTVAVVLAPREPYGPNETRVLRRFLDGGGTLVVADDVDAATTNPLLAAIGAQGRVNGTRLRDDRYFYRSPELPEATNVSSHPLTVGVDAVTLNHATAVEPGEATLLVRTSGYAYLDADGDGELDDGEALGSYPVITIESVGNGTVVVAGDPSLFINVMLDRPGNRALVENLFARGDTVVLDYSHAGDFPPLALAVLVLRGSVGLQVVVGVGGLGLVGLWARGSLPSLADRESSADGTTPAASAAELAGYLERRHPEWDDDRIQHIVNGVRRDLLPDTDDDAGGGNP